MSDEPNERRESAEEHRAAEAGQEGYEPPRVEDLPADGPAVTAAGTQGGFV